ncbi:MAG: M3 family metallopeptidase, partial [Breznakibacter sp.]
AKAAARQENLEGWLFTLHFPSYLPFMKYAKNRELRKKMFSAYSSRGNAANAHNNKGTVARIVALRLEKAKLLGFATHAGYVLEERMAQSVSKVDTFLNELLDASLPFAQRDVEEVAQLAHAKGLEGPIERWDFAFYSELLKSEKYSVDDELSKPYFKLENVETGVFGLANRLFGLTFVPAPHISVYHPDVKAFEVYDADGSFLSVLYIDYFPRPSKQNGAWMTSFREQYVENGKDVRPIVSLAMNFTAPTDTTPSLLTFNEVRTFLHEFGHALHGMLSRVRYLSQSGTNVYRDFVELPSQWLENWATDKEWLRQTAIHYQTGRPIPDGLIDKLVASDNFQSGYATVRQLGFGLLDMAYHTWQEPIHTDILAFEQQAMAPTELFPPVEGTCTSTAFGHIFNGGYAAGYYGYKWAEVLDADAFELFKQTGTYNRDTASRFRRHILEKGGSAHPMDLYLAFRGQEPSVEPLLTRCGLK